VGVLAGVYDEPWFRSLKEGEVPPFDQNCYRARGGTTKYILEFALVLLIHFARCDVEEGLAEIEFKPLKLEEDAPIEVVDDLEIA
jgi:hypothetical protein